MNVKKEKIAWNVVNVVKKESARLGMWQRKGLLDLKCGKERVCSTWNVTKKELAQLDFYNAAVILLFQQYAVQKHITPSPPPSHSVHIILDQLASF
jgi:hypothetical protein